MRLRSSAIYCFRQSMQHVFISVDAEEALTRSSDKFLSRFATVERLAKERNINMEKSSITELDKLWDEAKLNSAFCSHAEGEATDK